MKIKTIVICIILLSAASPSLAQTIGVISALPDEQVSFLDKIDNKENVSKSIIKGVVGSHTVYTTLSGVGKVNAASVAQELISRYQVDILIFSGVAGGINKALNIGDIVVASFAFQHDYGYLGDTFLIHASGTMPEVGIGTGDEALYLDLSKNWDQDIYAKVKSILSHSITSLSPVNVGENQNIPVLKMNGIIATGDQFIASESKKESLRKLQADVVEMEGAAVAQVAMRNDIPILIIRSVSDKAGKMATVDFKSFFSTIAYNNSLLIQKIIESIP